MKLKPCNVVEAKKYLMIDHLVESLDESSHSVVLNKSAFYCLHQFLIPNRKNRKGRQITC